jgi:hypothetical protein
MRRRSVVIGGIAVLIVVQLAILAGYAVILFRTELARLPDAEVSRRLSPFLEIGRRVDRALSAFYRAPTPTHALPSFVMDIAPEQMERLIMNVPTGQTPPDLALLPWVPAVFTSDGRQWDVHVRLSASVPAHWDRPKKSLELRFPDADPFHGKRHLLLLLPEEQGYLADVLLVRRAGALGLVTPEISLVTVMLNGRGPMIYIASEGWTEDMAERQGRTGKIGLYALTPEGVAAGIEALDAAYWKRTGSTGTEASADAIGLLVELSRPGVDSDPEYLTALSQVMDIDRLSALLALQYLMGHPWLSTDAVRLLYRNDRGVFEPVPWRMPFTDPRSILAPSGIPLLDAAARVPEIRSRAQRMAHEYLRAHAAEDIRVLEELIRDIEAPFYADRMKLPSNRSVRRSLRDFRVLLEANIADLLRQLDTAEVIVNQRVPSSISPLLLTVDITARGPSAAILSSVTLPDRLSGALVRGDIALWRDTGNGQFDDTDLEVAYEVSGSDMRLALGQERLLWTGDPAIDRTGEVLRPPHRRHRFFIVSTLPAAGFVRGELPLPVRVGNAVTGGTGSLLASVVLDEGTYAEVPPPQDRSLFLKAYPQFRPEGGSSLLLRGAVEFRSGVVIPPGLPLVIEPGTTVRMGKGAHFLSFSPVTAMGEPDRPIRFLPHRSGVPWGSLAQLHVPEPSDWQFVEIQDAGGGSFGTLPLRGALTLLESPGSITDVTVRDAGAVAAISAAQQFVDLRRVTVEESAGDGILIDHALAGRIEDTVVRSASGHGIDLQWSPVVLRRVTVEGSRRACLRAGEQSTPLIEEVRLQDCVSGLLAEEGGHVIVRGISLVGNTIGLHTRGGSPAFGPGSIAAQGAVFIDNDEDVREEEGVVVVEQ